ncbi:RepB family plasmid replication initiator protein [Vibrio sp. D404a]|uniref:replication initiation protein n=1 Tax=unclassified Vibrio TaxID=2614977 RepID=UPI002553D174|nr:MULTISPECIES: replication initiation protein [unclassified Vibrio]MDK9739268.1 RepB family plasmid replication initiator protein [Vibrio sp. D404a]MDK9797696.1 RepB family plasmid replication initiator protein [Vibrio sp. D449a]
MKTHYHKITQSNSLIEASFNLKLQERRLILFALSRVKNLTEHNLVFEISPPEYAKVFEINTDSSYRALRETVNSLRDEKVWIHQEDGTKLDINWVTARAQHPEGLVAIKLNEDLRPYLVNLQKNFTSYGIENIVALNLKHSFRIYELLKQYESIGTRLLELDFIRDRLMLSKSYDAFKLLRSKVIDPCVKEINESTDLLVSYVPVKSGRKIVALNFTINKNPERQNVIEIEQTDDMGGDESIFDLDKAILR